MPTVLQQGGFDFVIYSNDHQPSHVHVFKGNAELVVNIGDENTKPVVRENRGVTKKADFAKILRMVADNQNFLLEKWRKIHGQE
jgi:Domain of unknown function (DUF4160)